jgi:rhodanese-related sulfurtransferase
MKHLFSFALALSLLSCNAQQQDTPSAQSPSQEKTSTTGVYTDVSNEAAKELIAKYSNLQIIDVRTDGEVAQGIIEGARQMDISKPDFEKQLAGLDKNAPVLVYCAAGGRSKTAQQRMQALGFKEVHNLARGYSAWK